MLRHKLSGVGAAMITPFTADGRVDYKALARMIDYVIDGGVDYIVALGTTAETPTLYMPERAVIAMFITNQIAGRVPLVMGCGGNSTSEVLDQLREFDLRGADAILSVTPYYNKPSQEGLYQHFRTVSEHSPLPVILYNIPGRSGVNMTAETTLRCAADFRNVIGIKEASGDIGQMQRILDNRPEGFLVLSGDDGMAIELMRRGGDGVISVAANAFPQRFMECVNHAKAGDETLTDEDYHYLYYGYAYRDEYKPLAVNPDLDKMLMLASGIDPDKPDRATLETMVSVGNDALKRDPFSPKILNLMSFAYGALGDKEQEKAWSDRMNGVIRTILGSGDGFTQKTPRHVLMFDHALDVLAAEGLSFGKARIVSRTVEFVPLVVPYVVEGKKRKGFYFDFSRVYWNKPEGYTYQRDRTWQFNNLKPRTYK